MDVCQYIGGGGQSKGGRRKEKRVTKITKETRGGREKKRDTRKDKWGGRREKTTPLPLSYCSEQY